MPSLRRPKPTPKKKAAKKKPAKRASRPRRGSSPAERTLALLLHEPFHRQHAPSVARSTRGARAFALEAAVATKTVTFTCSNPGVAVMITAPPNTTRPALPSATFDLPVGSHDIVWSARGAANAAYQVTVTGGTLDAPIRGPLPPEREDGGLRGLTVS